MLDQTFLREVLSYDYDSGDLVWRERRDVQKSWNSKFSGKKAFTSLSPNGYKTGSLNNKDYYSHRVVWTYVFGFIPNGYDIDHINRDRSDNRICNLRLASRSSNNANRIGKEGSTSKFLGVSWSNRYKKWISQITKDYKNTLIGRFHSEVDAAKAYDRAAIEIHGHYARLNFPEGVE